MGGCMNLPNSIPNAPGVLDQINPNATQTFAQMNQFKQNADQFRQNANQVSFYFAKSKFPSFDISWDTETKNAQRLQIQGKRVIAKKCGMPYQAACPSPITSSCHVKYKVIKNTNSMGFGLMTLDKYYDQFIGKHIIGGMDDNKYKETILYSFSKTQEKGEIICEGMQQVDKTAQLFVASGQFLLVQVDLDNWMVRFTNKNTKNQFRLPESFRGKQFYFNGFVTQNGDSFEAV